MKGFLLIPENNCNPFYKHFLHRNLESHGGRNGLKIILTEEEVLLSIVKYYADLDASRTNQGQ
jgi:hypothetical protein